MLPTVFVFIIILSFLYSQGFSYAKHTRYIYVRRDGIPDHIPGLLNFLGYLDAWNFVLSIASLAPSLTFPLLPLYLFLAILVQHIS